MSSDSNYYINWLIGDEEDKGIKLKPGCDKMPGEATIAKPPSSSYQILSKKNEDIQDVMKKENRSSLGSVLCRCDSSDYKNDDGHLNLDEEGLTNRSQSPGRPPKKRQTLKRSWSSKVMEKRELQLNADQAEKARLFTYKRLELQCYIHPLSSILNGLRSGRYRERLSTFQESVAMDRIQRIMGVLQNPCNGDQFVSIILKMEQMLKSWFPHIKPQPDQENTAMLIEETSLSKRPKLSTAASFLTETAITGTTSALLLGKKPLTVSDLTPPEPYSAANLKWLHTSPICSATTAQTQGAVRNYLTAHIDTDLTQDSCVSSSTDGLCETASSPSQAPPAKISAPCLERLLKSTESIITRKDPQGLGGMPTSRWS